MARSCGIHIDQRRFHVVALEGSPKKHRVITRASRDIPLDDDPVEAVADELRRIAKAEKLDPENVCLAVDSGMAAFRGLTVPFDDRAKIEDIVKFEIESDLPQWDIDDVIVDFLVLSTKPGVESNLLVTAIPKPRLARQLEACERGGLEPTQAELDGTALFEAANAAGVLGEDAAHVLVHVGDSSTTVVVADGGRLASMRAIRAGAFARQTAHFEVDEDAEVEVVEDDEEQIRARLAQTANRIRREVGRTVVGAATEFPIEAIYLCGHSLEGLLEERELFDVPLLTLDVLPDDGDEHTDSQEVACAYGAALRALGGGVLSPALRREELKFTGKFERIELPLAVFSLLLCTLLGVKLIVTNKQISWRDEGNVAGVAGDMQLWLKSSNRYLLPDPETGYPGRLKNPPADLVDFINKAENGAVDALTKFEELKSIRSRLTGAVDRLKKDLGHVSDVPQPQSALRATTLVLGVLDEMGERAGRFGIRSLSADYRSGKDPKGADDRVTVRLDMDFFAESDVAAAENFAAFKREVEQTVWCTDFQVRASDPFDAGGITYDGLAIDVNVAAAIAEEKAKEAQ